ncbi:MAG: hypothetical protein NTW11_01480 [Candidatus Staskawiczbacteria bacterium]|nr:hypothetical protein [Candidatus Staskawiczbacteria bacterium]
MAKIPYVPTEPVVQASVHTVVFRKKYGDESLGSSGWFCGGEQYASPKAGFLFILFMNLKCSKCGAETSDSGDLHCRKILRAEISQLLLCGKIEEARNHISRAQFDEGWRSMMLQHLFLEPDINKKIQEFRHQQELELSQAQGQFVELADKYNIVDMNKVVDEFGPTRLAKLLIKLEEKDDLDESDLKWLEENKLFQLLADYYYQFSKSFETIDAWSLSKASKFFRKAGMNKRAIEITDGFSKRTTIEFRADSAVYASRGAAFRDLANLDEAKKCANEALVLSPRSFHPYNLLGGISYDEGDIEGGTKYFEKAIELGSSPRAQEREIQLATEEERQRICDYLLKKDPKKYAWVKKFQK